VADPEVLDPSLVKLLVAITVYAPGFIVLAALSVCELMCGAVVVAGSNADAVSPDGVDPAVHEIDDPDVSAFVQLAITD
jgi:hypothetical protein